MPEKHKCLDHLELHEDDGVNEEWWECTVCGQKFTDEELAYIYRMREAES